MKYIKIKIKILYFEIVILLQYVNLDKSPFLNDVICKIKNQNILLKIITYYPNWAFQNKVLSHWADSINSNLLYVFVNKMLESMTNLVIKLF